MTYEMGEVREEMAQGCVDYVMDFIHAMRNIKEPFYAVYHANVDKLTPNKINQTVKAYHAKPPAMIGILVWYVDNKLGICDFRPDLSAPPDMPINPAFLSDDPKDLIVSVAQQGKRINLGFT